MEQQAVDVHPQDGVDGENDRGDARAAMAAAGAAVAAPNGPEKDENQAPSKRWFEDQDFSNALWVGDDVAVRESLEVSYVGTTRAVVVHGFQVRELLFGDEFTSLRLIHYKKGTAWLRYKMEQIAFRMGLPGPVVEQAERVTYQIKIVHFVNKHVAAKIYEQLMRDNKSKVLGIEPVRAATHAKPDEISTASLTGRINLTWADGVATGGAHVEFGTVEAANAFLRTSPADMKAKPLGIEPEEGVRYGGEDGQLSDHVLEMREWRQRLKEMHPWRPPLRFDDPPCTYNRMAYFDETAINAMTVEQVLQLKYRVKICNGLAKNEDEVRVREALFPHRFTKCTVDRIQRNAPYENRLLTRSRAHDFRQVFDKCKLPKTEDVFTDWADKTARRAGLFVAFEDLQQMDEAYNQAMASEHWRVMERPYGQPVRLYVEYIYRMDVKTDVYDFFRAKIDEIGRHAQSNGVRYIVKAFFRQTEIVFRSRNLVTLQRIAASVEKVFECEKLLSAITSVLLSQAGCESVRVWAESLHASNLCVRVDEEGKSIWLYGAKANREQAITTLRGWVKTIQATVEVLDHVVRIDVARVEATMAAKARRASTEPLTGSACVLKWLESQRKTTGLFHIAVLGDGSRIVISGSTAAVKEILDKWASKGYLLKRDGVKKKANAAEAHPECGVCMLPADEPSITFALCGHVFCHECIRPGLNAGSNLPLACPVENCGSLVHVNDVAKVVVNMSAITETALFDYVAANPTECVVCPKSGCNQILPRLSDIENHLTYCESCTRNYCLECSQSLGCAMDGHEDLSCEEFRNLCSEGRTDIHVQYIRERIFTLCCPSCKAAFLDFDGCTSVACGNVTCRRYFCANCLNFSSKSSDTTHRHVLRCPKNPARGEYFVSAVALAQVHRTLRTAKMREYLLTNIPNREVRRIVLTRLSKDREDLQIPMPNDLFPVSSGGKAKAKRPAPPAA